MIPSFFTVLVAITDIDAPVSTSLNHPIVDFNRQVHGFTSVIFVHKNPFNSRGVVANSNPFNVTFSSFTNTSR